MTPNLPALPDPAAASASQIEALPNKVGAQLATVNDLETLREWHAQAEALTSYFHERQLHRPLMSVQRRIEARIGQLLSPPAAGQNSDAQRQHEAQLFPHLKDRRDFRWLARGLQGDVNLTPAQWELSRKQLVLTIRAALGELPEQRDDTVQQRVRRRRPRQIKGDRREWLQNAVTNAGAAAELAAELAERDTIQSLTGDQASQLLEGVHVAQTALKHVAQQTRKYAPRED